MSLVKPFIYVICVNCEDPMQSRRDHPIFWLFPDTTPIWGRDYMCYYGEK